MRTECIFRIPQILYIHSLTAQPQRPQPLCLYPAEYTIPVSFSCPHFFNNNLPSVDVPRLIRPVNLIRLKVSHIDS